MLSAYETNLPGNGTCDWNGVRGLLESLLERSDGYARGCVGILMKDE